jgi:glutaminyl-peptide cyclotransferase
VAATDSAVPCAMLLELARSMTTTLKQSDTSDITLQFIFFDGEEAFVDWQVAPSFDLFVFVASLDFTLYFFDFAVRSDTDSLYGARHLADSMQHDDTLRHIHTLVLLDLIGASDTHFFSSFPQSHTMHQAFARIESELKKDGSLVKHAQMCFDEGDVAQLDIEDDHIPFLNKGVRVLHLISEPFPAVWHTPDDDLDHIDKAVVHNLLLVFRQFLTEFFRKCEH